MAFSGSAGNDKTLLLRQKSQICVACQMCNLIDVDIESAARHISNEYAARPYSACPFRGLER